nr:MAG TPA: hypothetical protein [Caudoviricetes sp.]
MYKLDQPHPLVKNNRCFEGTLVVLDERVLTPK